VRDLLAPNDYNYEPNTQDTHESEGEDVEENALGMEEQGPVVAAAYTSS
jgi:hypothetical protein